MNDWPGNAFCGKFPTAGAPIRIFVGGNAIAWSTGNGVAAKPPPSVGVLTTTGGRLAFEGLSNGTRRAELPAATR